MPATVSRWTTDSFHHGEVSLVAVLKDEAHGCSFQEQVCL
jgi:hypothetical protein